MDPYYIGAQIEIRPSVPAHTLAGTRYLPDDLDDTDSEVVVVIDYGDHSCIVPRDDDRQTNRPEAIVGDVQGLVDTLGPGYTYTAASCGSTTRPAGRPAGSVSSRTASAARRSGTTPTTSTPPTTRSRPGRR